jgi:xanthine dehydrogenase accessory factor
MAHWGLQAGSGKLDILLEMISLPMLVHVYGDSPIARVAMALCGAMGWDVRPSTEPDPVIRAGPVAVVVASHRGDEERVLAEALSAGAPGLLAEAAWYFCRPRRHAAFAADTGRYGA